MDTGFLPGPGFISHARHTAELYAIRTAHEPVRIIMKTSTILHIYKKQTSYRPEAGFLSLGNWTESACPDREAVFSTDPKKTTEKFGGSK